MIENPFIISERIIPKYFCDREKESAEIIKLLKNGNNIVLMSPRRLGKTGLIQFCFENHDLKHEFIPIYIDILSTSNLQEFIYLLGREVFEAVKSRGEKFWKNFFTIVKSLAGKISFDPIMGIPSLNIQLGDIIHPEYTLKEIFSYISQASLPCIVAIDEFQQITKYPESNVEALIRSHLLQINNCRMIFSGSERHMLSNMFLDSTRPFYMSASIMELSPIPKDVYASFIIRLFQERNKSIPDAIAYHIYDMFDGVTFYIQRVCNGLFANTETGTEASTELLHSTLREILFSFDLYYRSRLSQLTTRQKELLFAISQEKNAEKITSAEFIRNYSLASSSAVQTSLKSLLKDGTLVKTEAGYRIEDRFFSLWLALFLKTPA